MNPETSEAEPLPPAPFEAPPYLPEAVAVGESVVVIGIPCHELATDDEGGQNCDPGGYAVAVYDLADGSWRTPELPPELSSVPTGPRRPLGATSDGRAVLEIGAEGDLWTFAPADGTWEHLASPGVRADDSCLAGDEVIVLTTTYVQADGTIDETPLEAGEVGGAENLFTEPSLRILALVGGEQGWRSSRTAGAEYSGFFPDLICLNDSAVAVDSGAARGVRVFDLATGEVSEAPPALVDGSFLNRLATATEILFFDSDFGRPGQAYNPATNTWRPFVSPPGTTDELVWTGEAVAGWSSPNLVYPTPPAEPGAFVAIPATVDLGAVGD